MSPRRDWYAPSSSCIGLSRPSIWALRPSTGPVAAPATSPKKTPPPPPTHPPKDPQDPRAERQHPLPFPPKTRTASYRPPASSHKQPRGLATSNVRRRLAFGYFHCPRPRRSKLVHV